MKAGWRRTTLGACCEIVSGATPRTDEARFWDGEVDWATPKDLSSLDGKFISSTERRITVAGLGSCAASILPPYSVLFSSRAPIGHVAINAVPMATNQGFKSLIPHPSEVSPDFLYHWLRARRPFLESLGNGATFKEVSKAVVSRVEIVLPPILEQRRIAEALDRADTIRRKRERTAVLLDELLCSAFVEVIGDPVTNPRGWPLKPLEALVDPARGISYGVVQRGPEVRKGVPIVRISNFGGNRFDGSTVVRTSDEISNGYRRTILRGGELVVSIRGTVGRVAIVPAAAAGWNVSREVAVVPLLEGLSRPLVHSALLSDGVQRFILGNVKGVAQSGINLADLRQAPIPCPPAQELERFESMARTVGALEEHIHGARAASEELFIALVRSSFLDA